MDQTAGQTHADDGYGGPDRRFVHLHLHSEYSLLDGGNRLDRLIARVGELGMDAVAVTDHGNLHAAVQFYETARAHGVKPILGCEAYVAPGDRRDRTFTGVADGGYHLVLLAENEAGWANLMRLGSEAYLSGFYFKPRMDRALLEECGSGLIAINGHLGSEIAHHLMRYEEALHGRDRPGAGGDPDQHWRAAHAVCDWHERVFSDEGTGPRFFVELQNHVPEQNAINPHLIRLARERGLPLVCDNDSHFLRAEDHDAHDTLVCISTGKVKTDPTRMKYTPELYVKGPEEMWAMFDRPEFNRVEHGGTVFEGAGLEALRNTSAIADRCHVDLPIGANHAPVVIVRGPFKDEDHGALPRHDDAGYGGDLSAWYQDLCSRFSLAPANDPDLDQASLKEECDAALRLLCEAGMTWRYGPAIQAHRHDLVEGGEGTAEARGGAADADAFDKWARLNRELKILADKLISAYFLIVWDFVAWGRGRGIPALARGSGVGTMTGYVLGLSNACPVKFGLLFERFTDPDRNEYPDIDIDLCQDGRGGVIRYVREKYGHVAQIITFGTLKARAAIRDCARVLELPLSEADRLAKLIPEELKITIDKAIEQEPDLRSWIESDERVARVIDNARVLEGQARHASVHAAGVIVATRPLHEVVPLYKQSGSDDVITQWDGPTCEKMGLLKMDFLGLRTLSIVERAKTLIRRTLPEEEIHLGVGRMRGDGGPDPLDLDRLTYDDPTVFRLFQRGDTTGVFQFESGGMRRLLLDMKPDRLEDLIAANALFRPGPMDLIPDYNARKHGDQPVPTVHPIVDKFTRDTYGVMIYQEQVMQIVHELGGIPLRSAYSLIKAISKKKAKVIDAERPKFIEGAVSRGLSKKEADDLFELILKFAGYGFNKSHSTGYAIVAYQTAYLKTYFPAHYMAAFLTFESQAQKLADWLTYLEDCKKTTVIDPASGAAVRTGVEVRPPDVNLSQADFTVVYEEGEPRDARHGHIRFGLRAIKGAGGKAIEGIILERDGGSRRPEPAARSGDADARDASRAATAAADATPKPYASLFDFAERLPPGSINKATIEALIKAGCFDEVHGREQRSSLVASIDAAVAAGQQAAKDRAAGQSQLFGLGGLGDTDAGEGGSSAAAGGSAALVRAQPWSEAETLRQEKETIGFYVSSHPLEEWAAWTSTFPTVSIQNLRSLPQDRRVIVPALVQSARIIVCKNGRAAGKKMAVLAIEDTTATAEAVLFADAYADFGHLLDEGGGPAKPLFVMGRLDHARGEPQVIVERLVPIDGCPLERGRLQVILRDSHLNGSAASNVPKLRETLATHGPAGNGGPAAGGSLVPIDLFVVTDDAAVQLRPASPTAVQIGPTLIGDLKELLGEHPARLVGGVAIEIKKDDPRDKYRKRG